MRKSRLIANITIFIVLFLVVILTPSEGERFSTYIKIATISATIGFLGVTLYYRCFWKLPFFTNIHNIINVGGKWNGEAIDGDKKVEMSLKISQHYDEIKIRFTTETDISENLISIIKKETTGQYLYFMFRARPKEKLSSKEDIFVGTMIIKCDKDVLIGEYFTSKGDKKKLELYRS